MSRIKKNEGLDKWLYIVIINNADGRVVNINEKTFRLYILKYSIRNIKDFLQDNDMSAEFSLVNTGRTYVDIEFTELGLAKLDMVRL